MAGRKKAVINWDKLEGLCFFDASLWVCSDLLGVNQETLQRHIRAKYDETFQEYKSRQLQKTVLKLKQKMIQKGLSGDNTCMIFVLKNISDWSDAPKTEEELKQIKNSVNIIFEEVKSKNQKSDKKK